MVRNIIQSFELKDLDVLDWVPRDRINLLGRRMTELRVGKGEVIYRPGQPAKDLYCVLEGAVGLSLLASKGNYLRLALLARGEFFGVSALVSGWRRVSRAMALRESRVGVINAKTFVSEICAIPWNIFTALTNATIKPLLFASLRRALFLVEDLTDRFIFAACPEISRFANLISKNRNPSPFYLNKACTLLLTYGFGKRIGMRK